MNLDFNALLQTIEQKTDPTALLDAASGHVDRRFLDFSEDDNPKPMDTLGNLVDKLCIVNSKMFFNQQWLYETRHESVEKFKAKWVDKMPELHAMLKRCLDLNNQRAKLMDEIDQRLRDAVSGKIGPDDLIRPQNKTY
jgi:hypothetical protein